VPSPKRGKISRTEMIGGRGTEESRRGRGMEKREGISERSGSSS